MYKTLARVLLATPLLSLAPAAFAASPAAGQVHFLVLGADGQPMPGVVLAASCQSGDGKWFGGKQLQSAWSCTADALGVCSADIALLPRAESERANECQASTPTQITEPGGTAQKSSYFTFFADGKPESFNLLQKGASWKHGESDFQSLKGKAAFDALAERNASRYYRARIAERSEAGADSVVLDSAGAHAERAQNAAGTAFLQARIDRKTLSATVRVVLSETYIDYSFHGLSTARYPAGQGTKSVPLLEHAQSSTCNLRDLMQRMCSYQEQAAFEVEPAAFRQAAAAYRAGQRQDWSYEVLAKSGHERRRSVRPAEFQAMAEAIDATLEKLRR